MSKKSLLYGVGINDSTTPIIKRELLDECYSNGVRKQKTIWICPYYKKWSSMLERCYSKAKNKKRVIYEGCSVCEEWLLFSNFKMWVDKQSCLNWKDKALDKDLLSNGNKIYSPCTCVFVEQYINNFTLNHGSATGEFPTGVSKCSRSKPYVAQCHDPLKRYSPHVGRYCTADEAHQAWKACKHKYSLELADLVEDVRVKEVLRNKYK